MISVTLAGDYDDEDDTVRFVYSYISMYLVRDAAQHLIESYNHHRVPGPNGGVPIEKMNSTLQTVMVPDYEVPTTQEAVYMYEARGGRLSRSSDFGRDPLRLEKYDERNRIFQPSGNELFSDVVQGNFDRWKVAFDCFLHFDHDFVIFCRLMIYLCTQYCKSEVIVLIFTLF